MLPHPEFGLNSGVMLMDLDKMRADDNWSKKIGLVYKLLQRYLVFCDQVSLRLKRVTNSTTL